ncbi:MAG: DUF2911 domain-containing protein [Planctomycetes bacterium]|nr:DUF2911 domain-containing protein [Planctomycetota bacterium]MBI3843941.1 DUF2911 domain-containing protein [Planctomycetota bacterium]
MRHLVLGSISLVVALAGLPAVQARAQDKKATELELQQKAQAAAQAQKWDEAAAAFTQLTQLAPEDGRNWVNLGFALHSAGKYDEALKAHLKAAEFDNVKGNGCYNAACVYAIKNDKEKAFEYLKKAADAGFSDGQQFADDEDLKSLRDDPRFQKMVAELKSRPEVQQPFVVTTKRASTRAAYFGRRGSAGQLVIDYGTPPWKEAYGAAVESGKFAGQRWRLGQDFWTSLDSNVDLTIGGATLKAGYYYLTLEQKDANKGVLAFHDPAVVHAKRVDASAAAQYKGPAVVEVPLAYEKSADVAKELQFSLAVGNSDASKGTLTIRFGPYKATMPIELTLAKSSS